tara:strand:- start:197 stop:388 length:192 start_codon:yes stop_codon:yes gene_type:complete
MWYITYNEVVTPHPYDTREDAVAELKKTFGDIQLDEHDVAFWPSVSSRGNTRIEICKYEGEIE